MAGDNNLPPLLYRDRNEICRAVGIPVKAITYYVENHGLPAWKIEGKGGWKARPQDLERWIAEQAQKYIGMEVDECD